MNNPDCLTKCYNYQGIQNDLESMAVILYNICTHKKHNSSALEWLSKNYPDLFEKLKESDNQNNYKPGFDHGIQTNDK